MAQRVNVSVAVVVVVKPDVVLHELHRLFAPLNVDRRSHMVVRRHRTMDRRCRVQRKTQRHRYPIPDEPRGRRNALCGQEMKRAALIIRPPPIPIAQLANQGAEYGRSHRCVGLLLHRLIGLRIHSRNICGVSRAWLTQTG
jgi:hypothetical protein